MSDRGSRFDWDAARARASSASRALDGLSPAELDDLMRRRAERYEAPPAQTDGGGRPHVVFRRARVCYAIGLQDLREIRSAFKLTRIPGVSASIAGVTSIRGQIVAVHDLSALRGPPAPLPQPGNLLVGFGKADCIGLFADSVDGLREYTSSQIHPPPVSVPQDIGVIGVSNDDVNFVGIEALMRSSLFFKA